MSGALLLRVWTGSVFQKNIYEVVLPFVPLPYNHAYHGSDPSIVPVEQCRLPATASVKSIGTD